MTRRRRAGPVQAGEGALSMRSAFGPYPMSRNGSGTSWQPDATPFDGLHFAPGDWQVMAQAFVNAIYDRQTGPRGGDKLFTESMAMLMADRPLGPGTLGLHAMLSLDPAMGKSGYPLLGQTGETADGATPLIDRQHPHDFFMELAASYSVRLGDSGAAFAYFGLPGEPALGPTVFMHRFSAMRNPEAPLTHHWLDSTHIVFGVATLGVSQGPLQLEGSWFNGREPDPYRWNIETRSFDSWSTRLSYNPVPELSLQVSYGDLKSPEQLEPEMRVRRTTASIIYQRRLGAGNWGTTFAYGLNRKSDRMTSASEPGWLLESTYVLRRHAHLLRSRRAGQERRAVCARRPAPWPAVPGPQAHARLHLRLRRDRPGEVGNRWPGRLRRRAFAARSGLRQPPALVPAVPAGAPMKAARPVDRRRGRHLQGVANASVWPGLRSILSTSS